MSTPPTATELLRGGRLPDGGTADLRVGGGIVTEVGALAPRPGEPVVDLDGRLVLPAFAEPHVHLDKAFTVGRVDNLGGDLAGAMGAYSTVADELRPADVRARAMAALRLFLAAGATAVRCHTGCGPRSGIAAIEVLAELRQAVAGTVDLQIVAHAAVPGDDPSAHRALLRRAVAAGADLIGGNPCLEAKPDAALDACFEVAAELGCGLDLHVDESTDPAMLTLPAVAGQASTHPMPVTASHCVSLGSLPPDAASAVADHVAAANVGVVTLPLTNLFLQGRVDAVLPAVPAPRGLTAIDILRAAGVTVAAGSDNVQDPFNPVGRCDPLEIASLLVTAGHQRLATAAAMVGEHARAVLGLPPAGPVPGAVADLVALRADSLTDAVARAPADRLVWRRGCLVARTQTVSEVAI